MTPQFIPPASITVVKLFKRLLPYAVCGRAVVMSATTQVKQVTGVFAGPASNVGGPQ
ncbi:hypothetical protein ACQP1W_33280 [Spirillospora sp. CA-255316]